MRSTIASSYCWSQHKRHDFSVFHFSSFNICCDVQIVCLVIFLSNWNKIVPWFFMSPFLNLSINKTKILMKRSWFPSSMGFTQFFLTHREIGHGIMRYTKPLIILPLVHFRQIFWLHREKSKSYGNSGWGLFGIIIIATEKKESKMWVCSGGHLEHIDLCIGSISYWTEYLWWQRE